MLFQASLLVLYFARMPALAQGRPHRPHPGRADAGARDRSTATTWRSPSRSGIFVALALGLNIVVGLAGLLDLGYVAFFAVGAYSWADLRLAPGQPVPRGRDYFPAAPGLVLRVPAPRRGGGGGRGHPARPAGAAAARRLPGDRDPRLRRGDPGPRQQSRQADQLHQRAQGHHADPAAAHLLRAAPLAAMGIDARPQRDLPALPLLPGARHRGRHRARRTAASRTRTSGGPGRRSARTRRRPRRWACRWSG